MYRWMGLAVLWCGLLLPAAGAARADDADILAMPAELQERFARQVLAGKATRRERLERLVDFVFLPRSGLGMQYEEGATHTVAESYATRRANCLGFTLLFLALAREAGLPAYPQVYEQTLSWRREDGTFYRNSHVNAVVGLGSRRASLDVARNAVITRGEPRRLDERQLLARYHNNLAVERLEAGELDAAQRHMARALELEPGSASHWSNAGVVWLRRGDAAAARASYEKALGVDPSNADALFNLVGLAHREGDAAREAAFRERLARVQQKDPFHHFLQAVDHERAGEYGQAVEHYRTAIKLHRRDHRFHAALANALQRLGDRDGARAAWQRAIALSEGAVRADYVARSQRGVTATTAPRTAAPPMQ